VEAHVDSLQARRPDLLRSYAAIVDSMVAAAQRHGALDRARGEAMRAVVRAP
jgi:hypothetical protein